MRSVVRAAALTLVAGLAAATGGCDVLDPDGLDELRRNRQLWQAQGVRDYTYVLSRSCFCALEAIGPVEITVRGGQVESREYVETGDPVTLWLESWPSIDGLFDLLERAADGDADRVAITYHPDRGYPLTADIDYIEHAIDDELGLAVLAFDPIGSD